MREAVLEYAARGNVVIVGRGAGAILGRRPGVLRVFLHAPREWRIERVWRRSGVDRKTPQRGSGPHRPRARARTCANGIGSSSAIRDNYDLCMDTSAFDAGGAVACLAAARPRARMIDEQPPQEAASHLRARSAFAISGCCGSG